MPVQFCPQSPTRGSNEVRVLIISDPPGLTESPPSRHAVVSMHLGGPVDIACRRDGLYHRGLSVQGDIDIIPPGTPSQWELSGEDTALLLKVPLDLLSSVAEETDGSNIHIANRFQIRDLPLEHLAWALKSEAELGFPGGRVYLETLSANVAGSLLTRHSSGAQGGPRFSYGMSGLRLRRVLEYIQENLSRDLSLKEIADIAGLSVSHCKTAFSKSVGVPIHQYIIQRRIERAKTLLAREDLSVSQIAAETGFTHKSHLAFHTRRYFGVSPTGLRRLISRK